MEGYKAVYLAKCLLVRYRHVGRRWKWDQKRGTLIPQFLIPRFRTSLAARIELHMEAGVKTRIEYIDPHKCFSNQSCLDRSRLIRCLRLYGKMQRNEFDRLPHVFKWYGRFYVWDGNHRITSAILLGKRRMRVLVSRVNNKRNPGRPTHSGR